MSLVCVIINLFFWIGVPPTTSTSDYTQCHWANTHYGKSDWYTSTYNWWRGWSLTTCSPTAGWRSPRPARRWSEPCPTECCFKCQRWRTWCYWWRRRRWFEWRTWYSWLVLHSYACPSAIFHRLLVLLVLKILACGRGSPDHLSLSGKTPEDTQS